MLWAQLSSICMKYHTKNTYQRFIKLNIKHSSQIAISKCQTFVKLNMSRNKPEDLQVQSSIKDDILAVK